MAEITCLRFFIAVWGIRGWLSETQVMEFGVFGGWGVVRVPGGLLEQIVQDWLV